MGSINLEERGDFLVITMRWQGKLAYLTVTGFSLIPEGMDWRAFPGIMLWKKENRARAEAEYRKFAASLGFEGG